MATYHLLNGDCLAEQMLQTEINENLIVCRECLIEGNLQAANLTDFWSVRADFIGQTYEVSKKQYFARTVSEFEKLRQLPESSTVCLWFENDLFCQTNMWFAISILENQPDLKIFRVFPIIKNKHDRWKGFGVANAENLERAYRGRIKFTPEDISLGKNLWTSYQNNDLNRLKELSQTKSLCFEHLEEICEAHIERCPLSGSPGRPEKVVKEIIETISTDFQRVFSEFSEREGLYGFGDRQIKRIYDQQVNKS